MGIAIIYEGQLQFMHGEITEAKTKLYRIIELENKLHELNRNKNNIENHPFGYCISYHGPRSSGEFWVNESLSENIQPILLMSLKMDIKKLSSELNELTK